MREGGSASPALAVPIVLAAILLLLAFAQSRGGGGCRAAPLLVSARREAAPVKMGRTIPKLLWQTTHLSAVPDLIGVHARGYEHRVWGDRECRDFLREHFVPRVLATYDGYEVGAFKADLWRYCALFVHGGVYLDIKTRLHRHLDEVFVSDPDLPTWFTCLCASRNCIYQGILASPPSNPTILRLIEYCVANPRPRAYHQYVRYALDAARAVHPSLAVGRNRAAEECLVLFEERCDALRGAECLLGGTRPDRYGLCCNAYLDASADRPFALVRDPGYPWVQPET